MSSQDVVVIDVFSDFFECLLEGIVSCHFYFGFDGSETRLHESVVVAVARATHALKHLWSREDLAILFARVLTATIGVVNQPFARCLALIACRSAAMTSGSSIFKSNDHPMIFREYKSSNIAKYANAFGSGM